MFIFGICVGLGFAFGHDYVVEKELRKKSEENQRELIKTIYDLFDDAFKTESETRQMIEDLKQELNSK